MREFRVEFVELSARASHGGSQSADEEAGECAGTRVSSGWQYFNPSVIEPGEAVVVPTEAEFEEPLEKIVPSERLGEDSTP